MTEISSKTMPTRRMIVAKLQDKADSGKHEEYQQSYNS